MEIEADERLAKAAQDGMGIKDVSSGLPAPAVREDGPEEEGAELDRSGASKNRGTAAQAT